MINLRTEQQKPVADILRNVQEELIQIKQMLNCLQNTFSPFLHTTACTSEFYKDVQSLDLVSQQVQELAVVMGNLASVAAPKWLVTPKNIVATLVLQTLANRICGKDASNSDEVYDSFELL